MKISKAFAVLVLVLAVIATASADGPRLVGRELARLDCTGRVTLMPDSFLHTEGAAAWVPKMLAWYKDAMFERVKCVFGDSCDMSDAHMEAGFWPSVQMIRNLLEGGGGVFPWDALTCDDDANAEYSRVFGLLNSFLELVPGPPFRIEDMPTCSFDDILSGRTSSCRWGVRVPSVDMVLNVALEQCPGDSSAFPFVSVTCKGGACDTLGKPCAASTECGGDLVCETIDIPDVNWMDSPFFAHFAPLDDQGNPRPCGVSEITLKLVNFWRGLWGLDATDDDSSMSACVPDRAQAPWFDTIVNEVAHAGDWVDDSFEDDFCYIGTHVEQYTSAAVSQEWDSETFIVPLSELMPEWLSIEEATLVVGTPWHADCLPTVTINGTELVRTFVQGAASGEQCESDRVQLMFHNPPLLERDLSAEVHFCPGHDVTRQRPSSMFLMALHKTTNYEWDCPIWVGSPVCVNYASLSVVHDKQVTGEVFDGVAQGMFFAYANSHAEAECMMNSMKQLYPDCAAGSTMGFKVDYDISRPDWHRVGEVNGVFKAEWDSACPTLDVLHDVLQCPTRDHEVQHMMELFATTTYYCMDDNMLEHNLTVRVPKNGFVWSTARVSGPMCALHFEVNGEEMPLKAANGEPLSLPVCAGYPNLPPLQLLDTSFFDDHKGEDVVLRLWQEDVSCCDPQTHGPLNLEVHGAFDVADHEEAMFMRENYMASDANVAPLDRRAAVGAVTTTDTGISMDVYLGSFESPPTTYSTGKVEIAMPEAMRTCYASAFKGLFGVRPRSDYHTRDVQEGTTQSQVAFAFTLYDYDVNGGVATRLREDGLSDVFVYVVAEDDEQELPVIGSLVVVEDTGTWPQYRNVEGLDPIVLTPDPFVPGVYAASGAVVNITVAQKRSLMPADVHGNWLEDYARVTSLVDDAARLHTLPGYYPQYETIDLHMEGEIDMRYLFTWNTPLVQMCGRVAPSHDLREALRRANPLACMSVEENDGMFVKQDGTTVDVTSTAFVMGQDLPEPPAPYPMPGHNGALARMECDGTVVVMDEYFHRTWVRLPKIFEHALTFVEGFFTDQAQCGLQFGGHPQLTEAQLHARFFPWHPEFWLYQYVTDEPAFDAGSQFVPDAVSEMPPAPGKLDNGGCSVADYVAAGNMCKMGLDLEPVLEGKFTMEFGDCAGKVWPHLEFAVEGDDVNKFLRPSLCNEHTPCDAARFPACPNTEEDVCLNVDGIGYTGQGMAGAIFAHPFADETTCNEHEGWIPEFGQLLQMEAQVEPTYTATSLGVCLDRDLTVLRNMGWFEWPLLSVHTDAQEHHTVQVAGLVDEDTPAQCGDINTPAVHDLLASFRVEHHGRYYSMEQNTMPSLWYMKMGLRPHGCATRFAVPPAPLWFSDDLLPDGRVQYVNPAQFDALADPGVEYDLVLTAVDRCLQESDPYVTTITPSVTPESCNGVWDYEHEVCECDDGFRGPACRHCVDGHYSPDCIMCPGVGDDDGDDQHYRVCNDHGSCDDGRSGTGVCTCADGYAGYACTLCKPDHYGAACTACACPTHATCDDTMTGSGNCTCNDGFTGDQCQHCLEGHFGPNCRACNCGEHGTCDESDGSCKCDDHWAGETCSSCAVHWSGDNCDTCAEGYFGAECAACTCMHGTCDDGLNGNGKCTGDCEEGWAGENCDTCADGFFGDDCEPCSCSEHGTCDEHGVCQCTGNWAGDHCERCKTGWSGDNCDACADDYFGAECAACTCMHGTCDDGHNGNGKCTGDCEEGWTGANCDACADGFYGNDCHPCSCSEHGTCNADGSCKCSGHWAGALCDRCADAWAGPQCDECADGYFGAECAPCTCEHGQCSDGVTGNGKCIGGHCTSGAWKGENCDQCASNYYGESCTECSCVWGTCADGRTGDGHCTCDHGAHGTRCDTCRNGFTGQGCTSCEKGYVGPDCIPCPDCVHGDCDDMKEGAGCICTTGWTTSPTMGLASPCTFCAESFYGTNCDKCYCVSTSSDPCPAGCETHTQRFGLGLPVTEAELEAQWGANVREEAARLIATVVLKNANDASSVIIISIGPTAMERAGSLTIVFDLIGDTVKEKFEAWARESGDKELGGVAVERVVNETTGEDVEPDKSKKKANVGVIAGVIGAFAGCAAVLAGVMMVRKQRARVEEANALTPASTNYVEMA